MLTTLTKLVLIKKIGKLDVIEKQQFRQQLSILFINKVLIISLYLPVSAAIQCQFYEQNSHYSFVSTNLSNTM